MPEWKKNQVVQINPDHDPLFGGHFMVITEPKSWGAQGYVLSLANPTGLAYYRCPSDAMALIGDAVWVQGDREEADHA